MNENEPIDYETEYHKTFDSLMFLQDKYKDLEEDWHYYQNLAEKYFEESIKLKKQNEQLKKENEELNSIKCFADNNGINIFNIDEAFRKCWNDNAELILEIKELKKELDSFKPIIFESEKGTTTLYEKGDLND